MSIEARLKKSLKNLEKTTKDLHVDADNLVRQIPDGHPMKKKVSEALKMARTGDKGGVNKILNEVINLRNK